MPELIEMVVLAGRRRGAVGVLGSVAAHSLPGLKRVPVELFAGEEREGHGCHNGKGLRGADMLDLAAQRPHHPFREF